MATDIVRTARILRWVTWAGIAALLPLTLFVVWSLLRGQPDTGAVQVAIESPLEGVAGAILAAGTRLLIAIALLHLARMLRLIETGVASGRAAALRNFALYLFLALLAGVVVPPLVQLLGPAGAGGARTVSLAFGSDEVLMLFVTGLLFLVARLLGEAERELSQFL